MWQFSKVYPIMADSDGEPTQEFFNWRENGFNDTKAHRHTIKGKPLYSYWNGEHLGYIEARKRIYIPAYVSLILRHPESINVIKNHLDKGNKVVIRDFDGYNFKKLGYSYEELIDNPNERMGHGHVICMILERPDLIEKFLERYNSDFN